MRTQCRVRIARASKVLAATIVMAGVLWPGAVQAHTDLLGSTPPAGDTVGLDTQRLILVFAVEVDQEVGEVVVRDGADVDVVEGAPRIDGGQVEVALSMLRPGHHTVAYRVVGLDGHPVIGSFSFTATPAGTSIPVAADGPAGFEITTGGDEGSAQDLRTALGTGTVLVTIILALGLALHRIRSRRPAPEPVRQHRA